MIQMRSKANNLAKVEIRKALDEDPSVFAYDEVYDDMKSQKGKTDDKQGEVKKAKYMDKLLKSAELRKREQERREEKQIQKEREREGDQFKDKEAFVTTAYKEKLKELRETEAREKNEAECEARLDVRKQSDLSGFYRHLLNQETGVEKIQQHSTSDRFEATASSNDKLTFNKAGKKVQRNFRPRNELNSDEEDDLPQESVCTESSEKPQKVSDDPSSKDRPEPTERLPDPRPEQEKEPKTDLIPEEPKSPPKPKVDRRTQILNVFKKRTVGEVFEEAVRRYEMRKQQTAST